MKSQVTTIVNVLEAKTHLSDYIARAEAGEEIVIARRNKPVVRLVAVEPPKPKRQFGFEKRAIKIHPGAFDAMTEADLVEYFGPDHPF